MFSFETLMQKSFFAKTGEADWENLFYMGRGSPKTETDLGVRTQTEELPMLPEFPSAARVSEYVCDLEYLFSRMKMGSYGCTESHLWLVSKIPTRTWTIAAPPQRGRVKPKRTMTL